MSNVSTKSLQELGTQLLESLTSLIEFDGRLPRPTDLSRWWELDQTLCVRTCGALRNTDPLRVLHQLSSTGSLRSIVEAGRRKGVDPEVCSRAEHAIGILEETIANLGGKKANLDTLIGSQLVEAREKIEATSKQSIFRGMSNLLGLSCDTVLTAYFVTASKTQPGWVDEVALYGSSSLRRLRPELTTLVGGRVLQGEANEELNQARAALHGGEITESGYSVALKDFCTDPFPEVEVILQAPRLLYTLPASATGESSEATMFFASIDQNAAPLTRQGEITSAPYIFLPRNPSMQMLLDVFVHRDLWVGLEPELDIGRGDNVLRPLSGSNVLDQFDFCESLQFLGSKRSAFSFKPLPRYVEMLDEVSKQVDFDLDVFRLYRLHVRYPVTSLAYGIRFPLPDAG